MRPLKAFVRSALLAAVLLVLTAGDSLAQITPAPQPEPGLCAPWHKCMAQGMMLLVVVYLLFLGGMYLWQRRGFDRVEHRQGNPEGVPVKRD